MKNSKSLNLTGLLLILFFTAHTTQAGNLENETLSYSNDYQLSISTDFVFSQEAFDLVSVGTGLGDFPLFDTTDRSLVSITVSIDTDVSWTSLIQANGSVDDSYLSSALVWVTPLVSFTPPPDVSPGFFVSDSALDEIVCESTPVANGCESSGNLGVTIPLSFTMTGDRMNDFIASGDMADSELLFGFGLATAPNLSNDIETVLSVLAVLDATVTVTYEYREVPVPAALWLFGSAFLGLVGVRRRIH